MSCGRCSEVWVSKKEQSQGGMQTDKELPGYMGLESNIKAFLTFNKPNPHPKCGGQLALPSTATAFSRHLHYSKINALSILCLHLLDMCAAPVPQQPKVRSPSLPTRHTTNEIK